MSLVLPSCLSSPFTCNDQLVHIICIVLFSPCTTMSHCGGLARHPRGWEDSPAGWCQTSENIKTMSFPSIWISYFCKSPGMAFLLCLLLEIPVKLSVFLVDCLCEPGSHVKSQTITSNTAHCFILGYFSCLLPQNHSELYLMVKIVAPACAWSDPWAMAH